MSPLAITVPALLVAFGHVPLLALFFWNLWRYRPHYEFFPVVLLIVGWLMWRRWPTTIEHSAASRWGGYLLVTTGMFALAGGLLLFSPWVAAVAAILSAAGVLLLIAGNDAWRQLAGPWLLLWVVIPPPLRLDDELIRLLQQVTSASVSAMLERLKVLHVLSGNVFRLPEGDLFVSEACSGINSQLVLVAAGAILAVVCRHTVLHSVILIASALMWSVITNIMRVFVITVSYTRLNIDLSTGWQHETIGLVLGLIGFCLLLSTDAMLSGLLVPVLDANISYVRVNGNEHFLPHGAPACDLLSRSWNRLFARPVTLPHDVDSRNSAEPTTAQVEALPRRPSHFPMFAMSVPFVLLGAMQVPVILSGSNGPEIHAGHVSEILNASAMPERIFGWQQSGFEVEQRERSSDEGQYTSRWMYDRDIRQLTLAADFPFLGWHELTRCYTSRGWTLQSRNILSPIDGGLLEDVGDTSRSELATADFVEVEMSRPTGETACLIFSLFDGAGRPTTPRSTHWKGWRGKLSSSPVVMLLRGRSPRVSETSMQVQLVALTEFGDDASNGSDRRELRQIFLQTREIVHVTVNQPESIP